MAKTAGYIQYIFRPNGPYQPKFDTVLKSIIVIIQKLLQNSLKILQFYPSFFPKSPVLLLKVSDKFIFSFKRILPFTILKVNLQCAKLSLKYQDGWSAKVKVKMLKVLTLSVMWGSGYYFERKQILCVDYFLIESGISFTAPV